MKNLILTIVLCLGGTIGYSQKAFYFYNFSSYNVEIGGVVTMPDPATIGGTYPFYDSSVSSLITVPAGTGVYTLENNTNIYRFPFNSPASSPYIADWYRITGPFTLAIVPSNAAWVLGADQVFHYVKFQVGTTGIYGGGNLGEFGGGSQGDYIQGNGWIAIYSTFQSGTYIEYTCVIF